METNKIKISAPAQDLAGGSVHNNHLQEIRETEKGNNKVRISTLTQWFHFFWFIKSDSKIKRYNFI